jgi:hypothetical protein
LPGAQFLTFNENGLIAKFRDFVRPLPAVLALQEAAGEFIASQSAATSSERSDQHNIQHRRRHGKEYN